MNNHYYVEPSPRTGLWCIASYIGGHRSVIDAGHYTRASAERVAELLAGKRGRVLVCLN